MTEIVRNCPLCGDTSNSLFDQRHYKGHQVANRICSNCGLVFQSPRMTEDENKTFYEAEYRRLYQGQEGPNPKDLAVQHQRAETAMEFVDGEVKAPAKVLDIGCSTGLLLKVFEQRFNAKAYGVEPGNLYREYARKSGLEVFTSLGELQQTGASLFNLVCMMHVLEHIPSPLAYLRELPTKLLAPDGWLLIEVPNLYSHDCFEVAHLVSYSTHTLVELVKQAGFRVVRLRRHGNPLSMLLPLYITILAQPDPGVTAAIKPESLVRTKRGVGLARRRLVERLFPHQAWIPLESIIASVNHA